MDNSNPHTDRLQVRTRLGIIMGIDDNGSCSWRGIPYALPLTPDRRFAPPEPVPPWQGVRKAVEFSGVCPQKSLIRRLTAENCLTLNIWSPSADDKHRPVLFFIHGGSFTHGTGSEPLYNGAWLVKTWDVVVVTINYRLGVLGFTDFSHLDAGFAVNCGFRDVLAALAWVHDNIADFGGDKSNITVIGQSAGGTLTSALSGSPSARRYVSKCMIMSGGPAQLQGAEDCRELSRRFLKFAAIETARQLKEIPLSELIKLQKAFIAHSGLGSATFRLSVDSELIPEYPIPAAAGAEINAKSRVNPSASPSAKSIPLLIGTTKEEMSFIRIKPLERTINVKKIVDIGMNLETRATLDTLRQGYRDVYGEQRGRVMLYTDLLFRISSIWLAEASAAATPVWMYRFDYETTILRMNGLHAFHATDLPYLFGNFSSVLVKPMFLLKRDMEEVLEVARSVQEDVVQFARTGELPWERCSIDGSRIPAKGYSVPSIIEPCLPPGILSLYEETSYRKRCFTPGENPVPAFTSI
jgi:para-nitrobenzyl esterase